jgi:S-adenosylmethionine synthetase
MSRFFFTSESVAEGHPDKVCDQISDAVLDTYLSFDPESRVAVETLATTNKVVLAGEVRGSENVTPDMIDDVVRKTIKEIGYEQRGFHWKTVDINNYIHEQSADIAQGVDEGDAKEQGAGDQGIMFGYACNETPDLMPAPIYYAHKIVRLMAEARHNGTLKGIQPDAKSQVTFLYENEKPTKITHLVVSTQHDEALSHGQIQDIVRQYAYKAIPSELIATDCQWFINPTGRFVIGGPDGDAGLTGRKIIVDTYGGSAPHGGGAFSGKDPTKVDRSAAYAARYLAKNIVGAKIADRCTVQLSYAIGVTHPLSIYLNFHDTTKVLEEHVAAKLADFMDLTPKGIRTHLALNRPIYRKTAAYGHFGRKPEADGGFSWEKLDLVPALQKAFL